MRWWHRPPFLVRLGCATLVAFAACGGKSSNAPEGGGQGAGGSMVGTSGTSGTPAMSGTGGSQARGCTYNGIRYEPGQTFGACNECECDSESGIACNPIVCDPGAGGVSGAAGGATGAAANSPGTGGVAGVGAASGAGATAAAGAGAGGRANQCTYAEVGSFCVLGIPSRGGQELVEGMPLTVSMRPAGCYSSSCTKLVSSDCNYIGSDGAYWVSGFICLATEGDACTDDCGGGGNPVCEPGITLSAGEYTVGIGGTTLAVKFRVPSRITGDELCVSAGDQ